MNKVERVLKFVDTICRWQPNELFYDTSNYRFHEYKQPDFFLGCKISGYDTHDTTYTKLGQWFQDSISIFQLSKFPYYIITWPIFFVLELAWDIVVILFIPKKTARRLGIS